MTPKTATLLMLAAMGLLGADSVLGQTLSSDWRALNGGGGISGAGSLTLISSIGSLETARVAAESVVILSGFLGDNFEILGLEAPVITITSGADRKVTLSWSQSALPSILQFTDSLSSAVWLDAPSGGANPVDFIATSTARFFRLRSVSLGP